MQAAHGTFTVRLAPGIQRRATHLVCVTSNIQTVFVPKFKRVEFLLGINQSETCHQLSMSIIKTLSHRKPHDSHKTVSDESGADQY